LRLQKSGVELSAEHQTLAEYLGRWLNERVKRRVRPSTFQSYSFIVNSHIIPHVGQVPLQKFTPQLLQGLLNQKQDEGLATRTVRYIHSVLHSALNQALKWQLVDRNVADAVDLPRQEKFQVEPYTPGEAQIFLRAIGTDRLVALYTMALTTGMRQGELLALQWADVDLEHAIVKVTHTLTRAEGRLQRTAPKTESSRRTLSLTQIAVEALVAHKLRQDEERRFAGNRWQVSDFVFTTIIGTPIDACNLGQRFRALLKRHGLRPIRFHDLRHTCASLLIAQGDGPRTIMEILGHSQIALTMNLYGHVFQDVKRESARKMDAILGRDTTAGTTAEVSGRVQ
jgi:integrase